MHWTLYLAALAAGAFGTALGGSDATLSKTLDQPITAGLLVQGVTVAALVVLGIVHGGMRWPRRQVRGTAVMAWLAGLGGASILLTRPRRTAIAVRDRQDHMR